MESKDYSTLTIDELKQKYLKHQQDNPFQECLQYVFEAATQRDMKKLAETSLALSNYLYKPGGVMTLFLSVIDFDVTSQKATTHNQRFLALANIVANLPKIQITYIDYSMSIIDQLKTLIIHENIKYSSLACLIVNAICESSRGKKNDMAQTITEKLTSNLKTISTENFYDNTSDTIIAVHHLLTNKFNPRFFVTIFPNLFYIYCHLYTTPSRLKKQLESSLSLILNSTKSSASCHLLKQVLFHQKCISLMYDINHSSDCEIDVKLVEKTDQENSMNNEEFIFDEFTLKNIKTIIYNLLRNSESDKLILEFFFQFQDSIWSEKSLLDRELSAHLVESMLDDSVEELGSEFDVLSLISTRLDESISLICTTLINYVTYWEDKFSNPSQNYSQDEEILNKKREESISTCLSIVEVITGTTKSPLGTQTMKHKGLPVLERLLSLDKKFKEKFGQDYKPKWKRQCDNLKIQIETNYHEFHVSIAGCDTDYAYIKEQEKEYNSIMSDLNEMLLPVRVHALVRIKQLLQEHNKFFIDRISNLYAMVEASLNDPESFVYLACINLIAEMSLHETEKILPNLIKLFEDRSLSLQFKLNVGEVLVKLSRQLKETGPHYAETLVPVFLNVCDFESFKDGNADNETLAISSLINLGEICKTLGHSLSKFMPTILNHINGVLESLETSIELKCATIDLLRNCLAGLDRFSVTSIDSSLKTIYNSIKKVRQRTLDDKLCLQADLTLEQISVLAKDLLFGSVLNQSQTGTMKKNIKLMQLLD